MMGIEPEEAPVDVKAHRTSEQPAPSKPSYVPTVDVMPKFNARSGNAKGLFERTVLQRAKAAGDAAEPLAPISYTNELHIKNAAVIDFWKSHKLDLKPQRIAPSPLPRHYRTTTKRRVWRDKSGAISLRFADGTGTLKSNVVESQIDVKEHHNIYNTVAAKIILPQYADLLHALSHVIVRGSMKEFTVILNVSEMNATVVRKLKLLADHIKEENPKAVSCYAYLDPTRSSYYLDQEPLEDAPVRLKKLYGRDEMLITHCGTQFYVPVTAFSQVNDTIIPSFVESVRRSLSHSGKPINRLIDLYCGYGLFSFLCADLADSVIGVEQNAESIESANIMAKKRKVNSKMNFIAKSITPHFIRNYLPRPIEGESIILDPPRQGVDSELIAAIAERQPATVIHIFCNIEEVPGAIRLWKNHGYRLIKAQPLDLFAGTPHLEVVVHLERIK